MEADNQVKTKTMLEWMGKADTELLAARTLLAASPLLYYPACFAQQCVEKLLKALLVHASVPFGRTHDLLALLDLLPTAVANRLPDADRLQELTPYAVEIRYPGVAPEPTIAEAGEAIAIAAQIREAVGQMVGVDPSAPN